MVARAWTSRDPGDIAIDRRRASIARAIDPVRDIDRSRHRAVDDTTTTPTHRIFGHVEPRILCRVDHAYCAGVTTISNPFGGVSPAIDPHAGVQCTYCITVSAKKDDMWDIARGARTRSDARARADAVVALVDASSSSVVARAWTHDTTRVFCA